MYVCVYVIVIVIIFKVFYVLGGERGRGHKIPATWMAGIR